MDPAEYAALLIKQLNDPRQASHAHAVSQQLQDLQLSPDGWTIADKLLSTDDSIFQFYGALTFQIKINRDVSSLAEGDRQELLQQIMMKLVACVNNDAPSRVTDKLWSVLGSFLTHATGVWHDPLGEVLLHLLAVEGYDVTASRADHVAQLSPKQLRALLKLGLILAQDLGGVEGNTPKTHEIEEALKSSTPVLEAIIVRAIHMQDPSGQTYSEALNVWSEWLLYGVSRWQRDVDIWRKYQHMTDVVVQGLYSPNFSLVYATAEALAASIINDSDAISKTQLVPMWPAIEHALQSSSEYSLEERLPILKLAGSWGRAMLDDILISPNAQQFQTFFQLITNQLFAIDWSEDGCDLLYIIVEFWVDFADQLAVELSIDFERYAHSDITTIFDPAIQAFFDILDRKDDQTMAQTDPDNIENWQRVRQDFADFLIKLMETDMVPIYDICADQLEQAIEQQDWYRVESVLQILTDMANDWNSTALTERGLHRVFKSDLFDQILDRSLLQSLPVKMKRTIVRFIDNHSFFFKQEPARIPSIVTLLMQLLEQHVSNASKLADLSAKCIASICSACRKDMVGMLSELLAFCSRTLGTEGLSVYQKEKIYSAIAFVIEALPHDEMQLGALRSVLDRLEADVNFAKDVIASGQQEAGEQLLVAAFQCLTGIGKALHDRPHQIIIDDDEESFNQSNTMQNSWTSPAGDEISRSIIGILQSISLIPESGDAWEGACSVLRVGLSETKPGPFVFPASLISSFLGSMSPTTPRLEALLTTACAFVSAVSRSTTPRVPTEVLNILDSVSKIILAMDSPTSDPALAQLCVDFLERLLMRYADVLVGVPCLPALITFCLSALISDAPMLKRTTAAFIAAFVSLPQQLARNEIGTPQPGLLDYTSRIIIDLLPHVATALVHQLGGNAQRSELEAISKVLRAFMMANPRAKAMLEDALRGTAFPVTAQASEQQKKAFINRIAMLRGGKGTTETVKWFWAECKGTVGSF
ncbi:Hypothetical protein D9617_31g064110 [Elsinoe fawcettii]|nr:Hypothetical protein D9617_31g064110 [Elsinoe fawcettii]